MYTRSKTTSFRKISWKLGKGAREDKIRRKQARGGARIRWS